jgi:uncharacterized protein YbjT (DUF2867 family)
MDPRVGAQALMNVLVLGASGLIGQALTQGLIARGYAVTALARAISVPSRRMPNARWVKADLRNISSPQDWAVLLSGVDVVVNCAGALQDGARDDVKAVQDDAMRALYLAANKSTLIVQISAHTDGAGADLPFLVTKRAADEALAKAGLPFVILRPAIVIGRNAYGGSALLRALAAIPYCSPLSSPSSPMRFIALTDLIGAVSDAIEGVIAPGSDIELAGPGTFSLAEAVARHRQWLGLGPVRPLTIPQGLARLVGRAADGLGRLGWRSPLRSTALIVAKGGIANPLATQSGRSLDAALNANPAGIADLWFARLYLLKPIVIGVLSFFWLASGAIALLRFDASVAQLAAGGFGPTIASATTLLTSCADLALGALVLVRRHSAVALKGMLILSLAYLGAATILTPSLWLDLLGPLVKVLPASVLALVALAILDER